MKKNRCTKLFVLGGYFFFIKKFKVILLIQNILPLEKKIFLQEVNIDYKELFIKSIDIIFDFKSDVYIII